ncbi:spore germination protein [Bacillus sp. 03113]|uniref:spore germination protein n=1 Tax=Bacillus sp. 03113 TaxID=2578211 RepID=UPI0015E8AF07|nr:spore germination protein [Bacillus sp. 03113]
MDFFKKKKQESISKSKQSQQSKDSNIENPLNNSLKENIQHIKEMLGNSKDIIIREIRIGKDGQIKAGIVYTDGLTDTKSIQHFILESLMVDIRETELDQEASSKKDPIHLIKDIVLTAGDIQDVTDFDELFYSLLSGNAILLLDGYSQCFSIGMREWENRGVSEPADQTVIRGPREAFTESLRMNTALIRRKIKDPHLWLESKKIGKVTKTDIAIMYIKGIVNDKIVEEVHSRLNRIDTDGILESSYIEEMIQDKTFTLFPTIYNTERPDVVAASLLEGRVAIIVDGTPFVLIAPVIFSQFYQSAEDYYQRADFGTLIRFLRYLCFFIALLGPSLYVAITTFHQEMIPNQLLISLAAQREGVPFPAFIEAMIMEVTFEILREAGVRMPRTVGQAVSIVGALVIGQAAVEAGIISAAMVIVVAITAIASFAFPSFNMAISVRILRFILMGLAASFGLFGITVGLIALVLHLCSLRSFGIPYMSPFAPFIISDQKDTLFRFPRWGLLTRPRLISQKNLKRQQEPSLLKPDPNKDREMENEGDQ